MLEFCLIALTWSLDPTGWTPSAPRSINAVAACIRPAAHAAPQEPSGALTPPDLLPGLDPEDWLKRWERASIEITWSRSKREEFRRSLQNQFNEHTAVAAEGFMGKIDARRLMESYDWSITEQSQEEIALEAIPHDDMDRLFLRSFQVRLSTGDGSPQQIIATGRNQQQQTIWTTDGPANRDLIQLIQFEEEVPPQPATVSLTGDAYSH